MGERAWASEHTGRNDIKKPREELRGFHDSVSPVELMLQ